MIKSNNLTSLPPLLLISAFLSAPICATADDDDEHGPPIEGLFKTELVFTQEQGALQIGTLPTYRDGPEGSAFELPIGFEYGITDSLQLGVAWDAYLDADADESDESGSGQGNLQLGLMYSLINIRDSGFHFAVGAGYEFASGDRKFLEGGIREDSQELYLIFAKDLTEDSQSQLFLQVGVELQKDGRPSLSFVESDFDEDEDEEGDYDDSSHDPNVWFANIGGYTRMGEAVLSLEINLSEEEEERYATPGISHQPMDNFEIGVGVAIGLTEEADDYQVMAKLLWEFGD